MTGQMAISLVLLAFAAEPQAPAGEKSRFEEAEARLASGAHADVFDLLGSGPWEDRARAGRLFTKAAEAALGGDDPIFASLLCERALAADPGAADARVLCMRVALVQKRYPEVESLAAGLPAERGADVRLMRAKAAEGLGDWPRVEELLDGATGAEEQALLQRAKAQRTAAPAESDAERALQAKLERAVEEARALERQGSAEPAPPSRAKVVAYVTSWCPSCKSLRKYLAEKGISHEVKDVEASEAARNEYLKVCRDGGIRPGGVPVVAVGARVIRGFDPAAIERALK